MIGFAQRAHAVVSGETAVTLSLRRGAAKLLIVAEDVSENTLSRLRSMATGRNIPYVRFGTKESLGWATGKAQRSALAIEDRQFARTIRGLLREEN